MPAIAIAVGAECLTTARVRFATVIDLFEEGGPAAVQRAATLIDGLPSAAECLELADEPEARGPIRSAGARALDERISRLDTEVESGRSAGETSVIETVVAEAEAFLLEAVALHEHAHPPDAPMLSIIYTNLATTVTSTRPHVALAYARRAMHLAESGGSGRGVSTIHHTMGVIARHLGDLDEAQLHFERERALIETEQGADHPDVGYPLHSLGRLHVTRGELDVAEPMLRHCVARWRSASRIPAIRTSSRRRSSPSLERCGRSGALETKRSSSPRPPETVTRRSASRRRTNYAKSKRG